MLEVGLGTGENTEFIASLQPRIVALADILPSVIRHVAQRIAESHPGLPVIEVHGDAATNLWPDEFDVVMCEGTVPLQADPPKFLTNLGKAVAVGGVIVITTVDAVGILSEVIRRFIGLRLAPETLAIGTRVGILTEVFSTHLDNLPGMTRSREDWVLDQLIHPWSGETLPADTAMLALGPEFRVSGSSPSLFQDASWYKDLPSSTSTHERDAKSYLQKTPILLDRRTLPDPVAPETGLSLQALCQTIFEKCRADWMGEMELSIDELDGLLDAVSCHPAVSSEETRLSIATSREALQNPDLINDEHFSEWWGRGQQHIALVRVRGLPQ